MQSISYQETITIRTAFSLETKQRSYALRF